MAKTFHNLIILDKSGSMTSIRNAALAGLNETIGTIRRIGRETSCPQMVSVLPFCGCTTEYIVKNKPVDEVKSFTAADYEPCCSTPLLDAIGRGCTELKKQVGADKEAVVSVTIITDGYENASTEWTYPAVKALIEGLKSEGWLFAFIGANIDVEKVSVDLAIDNSMSFEANEEDTAAMWEKERNARAKWSRTRAESPCCDASANNGYFKI